ncbi:MAG TPA: DoxX family protein [Alphaproteobacteria bacterium]|nr:DoxX family protein [Alphaproteobacteria bacterium]
MKHTAGYLPAIGRLLLSGLFVWAGYAKLMNSAGTAQYFADKGVILPTLTVWIAIAVELLGGLAILVGFKTRWAAAILAIWCLITAFLVHLPAGMGSGDAAAAYDNMIHFYKNLGMAGGLLYVLAFGAGGLSLDNGARVS